MFLSKSSINNISSMAQVMDWCQTITWTTDDPVYWHFHASSGPYELKGLTHEDNHNII